jgi:cellulose synthase/poly-beta-1,6-N-acetylglucosamine synthase-like glycosyltransferase
MLKAPKLKLTSLKACRVRPIQLEFTIYYAHYIKKELIGQRRRWLNGSFFASLHALAKFWKIFSSDHSSFIKALFLFQTTYIAITVILSWFAIGNYYIVFVYVFSSSADPFRGYKSLVFNILNYVYMATMFILLVSSFGNRPHGSSGLYITISVIFAFHMMFVLGLAGYQIYDSLSHIMIPNLTWRFLASQSTLRDLCLGFGSTYGFYLFCSFLYLDPFHMLTCSLQYLVLLPTWINVLMVYSFVNIHDISWGTKNDSVSPLQSLHIDAFTKLGSKSAPGIFTGNWDTNVVFQSSLDMLRSTELQEKSAKSLKLDDYFRWHLSQGSYLSY